MKGKLKKIELILGAIMLVAVLVFLLTSCGTKKQTEQKTFGTTTQQTGLTEEKEEETKQQAEEKIGDLEIKANEPEEGTYSLKVLERTGPEENPILTPKIITKTYKKIFTEVFNPTTKDIVFASIKLVDSLGNEYKPDSNPDPTIEIQDFGRDKVVSPSTKRKGYLIFIDINKDADTIKLVFELESGEKKTYEFEN